MGSFEVATVPRTLDEVAVGTADRMRPENPRVVFLLGLVEGEFPSAAVPGGLFSEEERERMARGGLPFIVEGDRSAATERMFCYRAATAATERLYAFYPAADAVGERLAPSELFARAAALSAPWEEEPLWEAQTPASIETALAGCGSPGPGEGLQAAALRSAGAAGPRGGTLQAAGSGRGKAGSQNRGRDAGAPFIRHADAPLPDTAGAVLPLPLLLLHEQRPWGRKRASAPSFHRRRRAP